MLGLSLIAAVPLPHYIFDLGQNVNIMTTNDDTPNCWICLEEGSDEEGKALLSGRCSCRGSSGCFHLSCVVENAKVKSRETIRKARESFIDVELLTGHW